MLLLNKKSVGINITDNSIEVVELSKMGGRTKVVNKSSVILNSNIVQNGKIINSTELATAVKTALNKGKPRPITKNEIIFALPASQTYIHTFTLPTGKKELLSKLVLNEALVNIPIAEDDLLYSYKVFENDKQREIILAATSRETISEWHKFFTSININIKIFDIEPLALYRSLVHIKTAKSVGIINIGTTNIDISVFNHNGLQYSYLINLGGEDITMNVAKLVKKTNVEVEKLKNEIGLTMTDDKISRAFVKILQPIALDIKSTFDYFKDKTGEKVEEALLVGESSLIKGLSDYLSTDLNIPVNIGKPILAKSDVSFVYTKAIGIALRELDDKWSETDPSFVLGNDNEAKKDHAHKEIRKNEKNNIPTENKSANKKLHTQKIILFSLLIFAIVIIPASYLYKNHKQNKKNMEVQEILNSIKNIPDSNIEESPTVDNSLGKNTKDAIIKEEIIILETPTKWLNVREGPGTNFPKIKKVYPKEIYTLLEEKEGWYKIQLDEKENGWIISEYAKVNK